MFSFNSAIKKICIGCRIRATHLPSYNYMHMQEKWKKNHFSFFSRRPHGHEYFGTKRSSSQQLLKMLRGGA